MVFMCCVIHVLLHFPSRPVAPHRFSLFFHFYVASYPPRQTQDLVVPISIFYCIILLYFLSSMLSINSESNSRSSRLSCINLSLLVTCLSNPNSQGIFRR